MRYYHQFIFLSLLFLSFHQAFSQMTPQTPDSLYSKVLEEQRQIWIQLPPSFNPENNQQYPVLYVLDGGVHLSALETIFSYQSPGYIPEMIVVGISNQNNRTRDLTTSEVSTRHGRSVEESGGAKKFTAFIEQELIPYIDQQYPTTPYRTLIGHSYAGLFTIHTLINSPHLFTNYVAIDPSLGWDNQQLVAQAKKILAQEDFKQKSLYVTIANEIPRFSDVLDIHSVVYDSTEFSLSMRAQLEFVATTKTAALHNGLNFSWKYYENEIHGTVPLISMYDALRYLFEWYPIKSPSKFNDPETPLEDLVALVKERTETLSSQFGYPVYAFDESLMDMLGHMYMDLGKYDKSLAFLKLNSEYYPESPNVYNALADYYENQKDFATAIKYMDKAIAISEAEVYKKRRTELRSKAKKK